MKKHNVLTGAVILSAGGILAKIFSAIYRIGLTRILGGVGIGLYQLVFPFYSLCVVLATAGLPMAISKVISKHNGSEKTILKKSISWVCSISLVLSLILIIFSRGLASIQGEKDLSICYILLAPTIIVVGVSSVLRGYFQGRQNFSPSAISNILEQFIKLVLGLLLSWFLIRKSLLFAIIGALLGIVVGEIISLGLLLIMFRKEKFVDVNGQKIETKEVLRDVLPITISNIILPLASFVDSLIVVNLLSINAGAQTAIYLYGLESGAVNNLVSLPTIFSFAIASVILPNISGTKNAFNRSTKLNLCVKIVLIISVPCALCLILFPNMLIRLLYGGRLSAFNQDGNAITSQLLAISGIGVVLLSLNQVFSSSLQAVDMRTATVRNLTIAVIIKFVIEIAFLPTRVSIFSLAIANTSCYMVAMALNYFEIRENFNLKFSNLFLSKLICANFVLVIFLAVANNISSNALFSMLSLCSAGVIYLASLFAFKIVDRQDLAMLKYKSVKKHHKI